MSDFVKQTTEYKVRKAKRKRWQKIVSVMASVVVFCTVYALILPAITWNRKGDLLLNGAEINNCYEWSDESGFVSLNVELYGEILFEGELDPEAEPVLDVEINSDEDAEKFTEYAEERDAIPYATFRLHMTVGEVELELSDCVADIKMNVDKKQLLAAAPMSVDIPDDLLDDSPLTVEDTILIEITDGKTELDAVEMSEETYLFTYSLAANEPVALTQITSNPTYTLQHYLNFPQVVVNQTAGSGVALNFINSSTGKDKPGDISDSNIGKRKSVSEYLKNGMAETDVKLFSVPLKQMSSDYNIEGRTAYRLKTEVQHTQIFKDREMEYRSCPQIEYMNQLNKNNGEFGANYTLSEIWVTDDASKKDSVDKLDFTVYKLPQVISDGILYHDPKKIKFTNNPSNPHISPVVDGVVQPNKESETYPYTYTILIREGSIIRLVFDITEGTKQSDANFFDYDVTDGFIYTTSSRTPTTQKNTSSQTNATTWYAYTNQQGINISGNYTGSGTKYAFGNATVGSGLQDELIGGSYKINRYNSGTYMGLCFGIVNGIDDNTNSLSVPTFASGIIAPDIFSENDAKSGVIANRVIGKTAYCNGEYKLNFDRQGGTYTISSITKTKGNAVATADLRNFTCVYSSSSTKIYSNEFWPMNGSDSHGTDGHDLKFGHGKNTTLASRRKHFGYGNTANFPLTDISSGANGQGTAANYDHNSFFGMSYSVEFTIHPGYCSPLDYWFYGDDDMWVFLEKKVESKQRDGTYVYTDAKLVADIGGVHSSVGEYANLWDYIAPVEYDQTAETYRLSVFYTERGASGSSCYMRFTVPMNVTPEPAPDRIDALVFEKVLLDDEGRVIDYSDGDSNKEFSFRLKMLTPGGENYGDIYDYAIYHADGNPNHLKQIPISSGVLEYDANSDGIYNITLKGGEYIVISNLPPETHYTIEELNADGYVTSYQKGYHSHDPTTNDSIDIFDSKINYSTIAGNNPIINSKEYNYVRFTNGPAIKTEVSPGEDQRVGVGDEIVYEIDWADDNNAETISVIDTIHESLDFVSARFDFDEEWWTPDSGPYNNGSAALGYDESNRTVEWTVSDLKARASGSVFLKVRVNEKAEIGTEVENRASIYVGESHVTTNTVRNPIWDPVKTETSPGADLSVMPSDRVTYRIQWKNYRSKAATVSIRDFLDPNVDFTLDDSFVYMDSGRKLINPVSTYYDPGENVAQWDLGEMPPGSTGYVELTVTVRSEAIAVGKIRNSGAVKIGNDDWINTNIVENPLYGYVLPSTGGVGTVVFTIGGPAIMLGSLIAGCVIRRKGRRQSEKVSRR